MLGFLVLLVLFIVKYPDIKKTLESTNFFELWKQRTTTTLAPATKPAAPATTSTTVPNAPDVRQSAPPASPGTGAPAAKPAGTSTTSVASPAETPVSQAQRQAALYFVRIGEDGGIQRREVKRTIAASDSPLADALHALLAGPSEAEIRTGLVSLIPRDTVLKSVTVRNATAVIDLSEAFMYNRYGPEGFRVQLEQIVYTATAFGTVSDVQILIEGARKEYLGGEGVFIGSPLSRASF